MQIAFVGPKNYGRIFSFLGFSCFCVSGEKEALEIIEKIKKDGFSMIFASRDILDKEIDGVTIISGISKKTDDSYIEKEIQKAIGSKISLK